MLLFVVLFFTFDVELLTGSGASSSIAPPATAPVCASISTYPTIVPPLMKL